DTAVVAVEVDVDLGVELVVHAEVPLLVRRRREDDAGADAPAVVLGARIAEEAPREDPRRPLEALRQVLRPRVVPERRAVRGDPRLHVRLAAELRGHRLDPRAHAA